MATRPSTIPANGCRCSTLTQAVLRSEPHSEQILAVSRKEEPCPAN